MPALRAGCRGPLATCYRRGCASVGAQHCPLGLHALWGLRAAAVVGGRPRGGWPVTVVRGVWCQAQLLPRPPVLWSGQLGFRDPCVPGAVGAGVGAQHRPLGLHVLRGLRALGVVGGRSRGLARHRCVGFLVAGAVPLPAARPLERPAGVLRPVCPGCGWCGRGGPAPAPWLACPEGAACRGGGGGPFPGGGPPSL